MPYPIPAEKSDRSAVKEQLRLFAFSSKPVDSTEIFSTVNECLSKRERLTTLLEGELNFHGKDSSYASHNVHSFAAKFPPQLPRAFIRGLTQPGDVVLDPMVGSGTTIVEALLEGRKGIGFDIDPLAIRLSRVKTTPLTVERLTAIGTKVIGLAYAALNNEGTVEQHLAGRFDKHSKAFIDYWFKPDTQHQLMALVLAIEEITDVPVRRFLELTFSSIIVTKSGGVSMALDLAHTRPHLDKGKIPKDALDQFARRLRASIKSMAQVEVNGSSAITFMGDARFVPLADGTVDLIVTSPPYANAIDYMRAHKFSLVWFKEPIKELSELRAKYIGSERIGNAQESILPTRPMRIINQLADRDPKKGRILKKYFIEMESALAEMYRVLKPDCAAIVVAGPSMMRGLDVQTHYCLADIAGDVGFEVVDIAKRLLDRNKRMMPARFGKKSDSMIEQRMHEEYVIGLLKPGSTDRVIL